MRTRSLSDYLALVALTAGLCLALVAAVFLSSTFARPPDQQVLPGSIAPQRTADYASDRDPSSPLFLPLDDEIVDDARRDGPR